MSCKKCGTANDDEAKYCLQCGSKLSNPQKVKSRVKAETQPKFKINSQLIVILAFLFAIIIVLLIHEDNRKIVEGKLLGSKRPAQPSQQMNIPEGVMEQIQTLKSRIEKDPHDIEALIQLGNSYFDISRFEEAVVFYQHALEHNNQNTNLLIDLGVALFNLKQNEKAILHIEQALKIDPNHKQGLFNLGVIQSNLNNITEAINCWESVIRLYPDSREAQNASRFIGQLKNKK